MMINSMSDRTTLSNGTQMPWLGFGVFQIEDGQVVEEAVAYALESGYRSIDTASIYGNERGVGKAIRESGIPREDIFLTTKLWNDDQRKRRGQDAFKESLERLETDYVDLYLVHWPVVGCYVEAWEAMEEIYAGGRAKAIGVSNFLIPHLEEILASGRTVPAVNQVEFHPYLVQPELLRFCQEHDIRVEAWSPLMQGKIVEVPAVAELAKRYGKTPAQIVLRWDLQHQVVTIPKSVRPARIRENADLFDFELTDEEMSLLDRLDQGKRVGPDPANFDF